MFMLLLFLITRVSDDPVILNHFALLMTLSMIQESTPYLIYVLRICLNWLNQVLSSARIKVQQDTHCKAD